jgi:hypothetical protein
MPFAIDDLRSAYQAYQNFLANNPLPFHARYIFPFFAGSYFTYRKIDVIYVVTIAKSIANDPSYLDVGCGYGDFLKRIREFLPEAKGIEKDAGIFYSLAIPKPDFIEISDARWINKKYDMIFVGWMEPGQDFREYVARSSDVIVTTLDQGLSLAAEFDGHGFERIAWWRTPSWEDVNTEIMNTYYTEMSEKNRTDLKRMRGAHNLWYVYSKPRCFHLVKEAIRREIEKESISVVTIDRYSFENLLDECGYRYMQKLENPAAAEPLWQVQFDI